MKTFYSLVGLRASSSKVRRGTLLTTCGSIAVLARTPRSTF